MSAEIITGIIFAIIGYLGIGFGTAGYIFKSDEKPGVTVSFILGIIWPITFIGVLTFIVMSMLAGPPNQD
jgi:hypothetical protein